LGMAFALFAGAFHPPSLEAWRYLAGTVAASYLIGYIFFILPAGAGAREGAMFLLLQQVMPVGAAVVVIILSRVWFTAAEIAPLALLPVLRRAPYGDARNGSDGDTARGGAPEGSQT